MTLRDSLRRPPAQPFGLEWQLALGDLSYLEEQLGKLTHPDTLYASLQELIKAGYISEEQGDDLLNRVYDQVFMNYLSPAYDYLNEYTSEIDLFDRINTLQVDRTRKAEIYDFLLPPIRDESDTAVEDEARIAVGATPEEQRQIRATIASEHKQRANEIARLKAERASDLAFRAANKRAVVTPEEEAKQRKQGIFPTSSEFEKAYAGTPEYEQRKAEKQLALETIYGKRPDMQDRQAQIDAEQARLTARDKQRSEGQTADALLAMMNRKEPVPGAAPIPNMPSELSVVQPAINAANYGEGTKLRSFIESQIAQTAQTLRPERLAWWQKRNEAPEPEEKTYEDVLDRLTVEANKWQTVAQNAPTSEVAGNTAYGVGGLKAIAEKAYAEAQGRLAKLNPADFPTRTPIPAVTAEEDPLTQALTGRKWWEEYSRLPGAGTVSRLQKAVRYR